MAVTPKRTLEITKYVLRWVLVSVFKPTSFNTARATKAVWHVQCKKQEGEGEGEWPVAPF